MSDGREQFTDKSQELQHEALKELPEGTSSNIRGASSYAPYSMVFMEEGDGALLSDVDGNEYVDCLCGVSAIISGHCVNDQIQAVEEQLHRGTYFATAYEQEHKTAKLVNDLIPSSEKVKFISTGTEAAMSAIRLARAYTGKEKILKFEGMYHGHTDHMLFNVHPRVDDLGTRHAAEKIPSSPGIPNDARDSVMTLPWNDPDLLEKTLERHGDEIAAIITEAFLSNSGLLHPQEDFNQTVRKLTEEHDILLILDEVITGFRTDLHGAEARFDIKPDISIWGKALANGYPCAAVTGREEIMDFIGGSAEQADFMGTFSGNPLVIAAAKANLERLQDIGKDGYKEFHARGQRLVDGLHEILTDAGHDVYVPDFIGFSHVYFHDGETDPVEWTDYRDVDQHASEELWCRFAYEMIQEGVYMVPRPYGRINLTHAHTDDHIDKVLDAAAAAAERVPETPAQDTVNGAWN